MPKARILNLEDNDADAELLRATIQAAGIDSEIKRVAGRKEFEKEVDSGAYDLIVSDYKLPGYDGSAALDYTRKHAPDVPFILLSGTIGEEAAVLCLLGGATDYVLKDRPQRLVASLQRGLKESSERKRLRAAETETARSRRDLDNIRLALDNSGEVAITDVEGKILYVNDLFCKLSKYPVDELVGKNHRIVNSGYHPKSFFKELWDTILAGKVWHGDVRNRAKDGSIFWCETTITPFLGESGKPYRFVAIRHDITDRKRVEEELREIEEGQRLATAAANIGMWSQDIATGKTMESPIARACLGGGEGLRSFDDFLARVHPDDRPAVEAAVKKAIADKAAYSLEFRVIWPDRSVHWLAVVGRAYYDETGAPRRMTGTVRDVTEARVAKKRLEDAEAQLRQAQKMESIGRLAGGIAHDFNNLLTGIGGYTYFLLGTFPPDDPRRADVEEIRKAAERAAGLTRQLLAFSRQQILEPKVVDLNELVGNMEKMLKRIIGEGVRLVVSQSQERALVKADPGQIEQIVMNLVVNARDAMPEGGAVSIVMDNVHVPEGRPGVEEGDYVTLSVKDEGCGMDESIKAHLFEPFFTTKPRGKGTGLGLATVYGIVRQSQGRILVESAPNKGSRFDVYLPRATESLTPAAPRDANEKARRGAHATILLVEDDETVRKFAGRVLAERGFTVLSAAGPQEAVRLCERTKEKIDLLLTDVVMPELRGDELARRLVQARPGLKVMYMSGYSEMSVIEGAVAAGAPFLHKPMTPQELLKKLEEVLGAK